MARRLMVLALVALTVTSCAGSDDAEPTTPTTVVAESTTTMPAATTTTIPSTTSTVAPTTTIDEATVLAEVEQAYLDAFWVATEALRNPDDPDNEALIRQHYVDDNLELALSNLQLTRAGGLVARENAANPTFAVVIEQPEFIDDLQTVARLTVCEFNSDRIFEFGRAPDGTDALRRDDPVSYLIVVRMKLEDGSWRSQQGSTVEEVRDTEERCSDVR